MKDQNIETRIQKLESIIEEQSNLIEKQGKRIQRCEDVNQIQNLLASYVYTHEVGRTADLTEKVFAINDPDVSWEVAGTGYFKGSDSVKKALGNNVSPNPIPGNLSVHCLTTPVIEVADDGRTAKGIWISPGAITIPNPQTGKMKGFWAWTRYGCDFIKEDNTWKIWHYHVYSIFLAPSGSDFAEPGAPDLFKKSDNGKPPARPVPDGPTTFDNPYNQNYIAKLIPAPPQPYKAFEETFSYGPPSD